MSHQRSTGVNGDATLLRRSRKDKA